MDGDVTMQPTQNRSNRGQTGVGAVYAIGIMLVVMTGVMSVGYAYISTPAVSSADTTTESSAIAADIIRDELTKDYNLGGGTSPPQLDQSQVEYIFPVDGSSENSQAITNHSVANRNNLSVRVVIQNTTKLGNNSMLADESGEIAAGDPDPPASASVYHQPATIQQQLVTVKFKTWRDFN